MNRSQFDRNIKNALSNHSSEVDVDGLWADMEADVDAINAGKKKKRRAIWWFMGLGTFLLGFGLAYILLQEDKIETTALGEEPIATSIESSPVRETTEIQKTNTLDLATKPATVLPEENDDFKDKENVLRTPATKSVKFIKSNEAIKTVQSQPTTSNDEVSELVSNPSENLRETHFSKREDFNSMPALGLSILNVDSENWLLKPQDHRTLIQKLSPTQFIQEDQLEDAEQGMYNEPFSNYGRDRMRFSIAAQTSISLTDRKLEAPEELRILLGLRETSEKTLETIQMGLRLNLHLKSGLEFGSGINLTQINERFDYRHSFTTVDSIWGIEAYQITLEGDTVPIYGNIPHIRDTIIRKKYFNKYRMIEIPVMVGFRFKAQRTIFGVQAGTFVNLSMTPEGRILTSESQEIDINKEQVFKTNIGLSYYFGVSIEHPFNDNFSAYVSPFMRYFPENFAKSSYGLKQQYALYGIDVGVRYLLD